MFPYSAHSLELASFGQPFVSHPFPSRRSLVFLLTFILSFFSFMACHPSQYPPSTSTATTPSYNPSAPRKRTMSFSAPLPHKSPRTLQRTGSFLSLSDMQSGVQSPLYGRGGPYSSTAVPDISSIPYTRSLRHYKEQRDKRKAALPRFPPTVYYPAKPALPSLPSLPSPKVIEVTVVAQKPRMSSPLSPIPCSRPPRTFFPRSKREPDLYRVAITTRMRMTPEGQKILHMGPRLALSILTATRELEKIVAAQREADTDIIMTPSSSPDGALSASWVLLQEDWEMLDCNA